MAGESSNRVAEKSTRGCRDGDAYNRTTPQDRAREHADGADVQAQTLLQVVEASLVMVPVVHLSLASTKMSAALYRSDVVHSLNLEASAQLIST